MRYDKIGNIIKQISEKNKDGLYNEVLGISIDKEFMPSVANIIGTDLKKYNIIRKNRFAFNPMHVGRDKRLPIALYKSDEPALLSPAYIMFEVTDSNVNVNYLYLLLKSQIFDDYCWFHTDSTVRGGLSWEDFANYMIPIPDLDLQKKIVLKHKSLIERVTLLEDYNSILYDLLDLLYKSEKKKWVDTETIDLKSIAKLKNGYSYSSDELGASNIGMATIKNFKKGGGFRTLGYKEIIPDKELNNDLFLKKFDIIIAHTDLTPSAEILGNVELILDTNDYDKIIPSMDLVKVWSVDDEYSNELLYTLIKCSGFKDLALQSKNGTTVLHLEKDALKIKQN